MSGSDPRVRVAAALRTHSPQLRRHVASRVPSDLVDDVRQAAALRAIEKAETLRDLDRLVPWLYRIHTNAANDALRKLATEQRLLEAAAQEPDPIDTSADAWCRCSIAQTRKLMASYALILELVDIQGLRLDEAAMTLDISVNNAAVRLHRARAALKKQMLEHCGVTSANACADCRCVHEGCCAV